MYTAHSRRRSELSIRALDIGVFFLSLFFLLLFGDCYSTLFLYTTQRTQLSFVKGR